MANFSLYVFDAYGTLFDVHSAVARHRDQVGPQSDRLSELWRTKQLEYAWVRTLSGRYRDFAELTREALDFAASRCGGISASTRDALLSAYERLDAFADVAPTLTGLRERGARTAILSNGTPAMLESAIASAGIGHLLDATLSVDVLKVFKTAPAAYDLVRAHFGASPADVSFQSSNRWDIAGASQAGFRSVWINRGNMPDEYADLPPAAVLPSLAGLLTLDA